MISIHTTAKTALNVAHGWGMAQSVDFDKLAVAVTRYMWSPCVWRDGIRREDHFQEAHVVALDFDEGLTLEEACSRLCDMQHVIATTKSHQKAKNDKPALDRFRVILKLARPIVSLVEYRATVSYLIRFYDADTACKDGARFFYPCVDIVSVNDDRDDFCVEPVSPEEEEKKNAKRIANLIAYRGSGFMPRRIEGLLKFGAPTGRRNVTVFGIAADLTMCGFPKDEIIELILNSPIGLDRDEVASTVGSGVRRAERELDEREKQSQADERERIDELGRSTEAKSG